MRGTVRGVWGEWEVGAGEESESDVEKVERVG